MIRFTTTTVDAARITVPGQYRIEADGTHAADCRCEWGCDTFVPAAPSLARRAASFVFEHVGGWVGIALAVLALAGALAFNAAHATADPLPLTLTDAHGWTPTATLDTAQVEQGEPVPAPADVPSTFDDVKALYPLLAAMADAGSPDVIRADDTDAPELSECVIVVGDTSVLVCSDGFTSQS